MSAGKVKWDTRRTVSNAAPESIVQTAEPSDLTCSWDDPGCLRQVSSAVILRQPLEYGGTQITIEHQDVAGVTPEMLEWWYAHFPYLALVLPGGETISAYRLWHPADHRNVHIKRHSLSGQLGVSIGARLVLTSRWGSLFRTSSLRVRHMNVHGLAMNIVVGPCVIGVIEECFEPVADGTRYTTSLILHPDRLSLLGIFRSRLFTPATLDAWVKHKVEEIGNMERVVPLLYRLAAKGQ